MKKLIPTLGLFAALILNSTAHAAASTGARNITSIGCHLGSTTCYADIDGSFVGPATCSSYSLRWDSNTTNGKEILSLLTAAYMANKKVSFYVIDTCYTGQTMYPTFAFINLMNN